MDYTKYINLRKYVKNMSGGHILLSTTRKIPGHKITQYRGIAFGVTVRSRGAVGDACAGCQSTCGGEVSKYTEAVLDSRNEAIQRLVDHAASLGANAVVGLQFDSDEIGQGANNAVIAVGTAVVVQKKD